MPLLPEDKDNRPINTEEYMKGWHDGAAEKPGKTRATCDYFDGLRAGSYARINAYKSITDCKEYNDA